MSQNTDQSVTQKPGGQQIVSGLAAMTVDQLFDLICTATARTIDEYRTIAEAICELDRRGADLSRLQSNPLIGPLRKVGHGQLSLNAVAALPFHVLKYVDRLPLPLQELVAKAETEITVVALREDGDVYKWKRRPAAMTPAEARRVFAKDHIRTEAEQVQMLRMAPANTKRAIPSRMSNIALDRKRGGITVTLGGNVVFISELEMLESLSQLRK